MNFYKALQAQALLAILRPDHPAFLRYVKRFVSKTFHIPFTDIDQLFTEESLLQLFYEETFEQIPEESKYEFLHRLTETEEEEQARLRAESSIESKDDAFFDTLNKEVKAGSIQLPKEKKAPKNKKPTKKEDKPTIKEEDLPPDIHMNFNSNLPNEWGEMETLNPPPRKVNGQKTNN